VDATEHFIAIENIEHFFMRLGATDGQDERKMLTRLLLEEEDRFARSSEQLDLLDRYIAKCDGYITKQKRLIETGNISTSLVDSAHRLLSNFHDIRSTLLRTRMSLEQANGP
jgi:hypothetical protein